VLNVANVEKTYFAAFLSGRKRTEKRWRKRVDARLEAVKAGEPVVLLEIGSDRALRGTVSHIMRFDYPEGGYLYSVRVCALALIKAAGVRKIQGWHRRERLPLD
jgi:hypothetical protein